jgi:hypothetical protein
MTRPIDINDLVDQQELDEERDRRAYGNTDFDYITEEVLDGKTATTIW